jgi:hypothetical protein
MNKSDFSAESAVDEKFAQCCMIRRWLVPAGFRNGGLSVREEFMGK